MRPISIGYPTGEVKMILWHGTEDEQAFPVKCLKRGKPYVKADGIKYELTAEEVNFIRSVLGIQKGMKEQ